MAPLLSMVDVSHVLMGTDYPLARETSVRAAVEGIANLSLHERSVKMMMEILTRGVGRGEIDAEKLTPRLAALPFDLARHQLVLLQRPLSTQDIEEIIDRIFLPLVRAD